MVCEKNADVVHDFMTDPIRLVGGASVSATLGHEASQSWHFQLACHFCCKGLLGVTANCRERQYMMSAKSSEPAMRTAACKP
jgi:hypothetical protein